MNRIAAYCRVSTDKEEQRSSLQNQREFFEDYAKKNGLVLVNIYADEGISGKQMKRRPQFLKLLEDAKQHKFDRVVTKDISRFARNTADFLYGIRTLKCLGIDVVFLSNNQTVLGESEFVLTMFAALAQQESEFLSKRVIFGKQANAKKGRTPNVIYGYDKTGTFDLAINPSEARVVRKIFDHYTENGYGLRKIAQILNTCGDTTKKNALWTAKSVRRILENPIYAGELVNHKTETQNFLDGSRRTLPRDAWFVHPRPQFQIVDKKQFLKAKEILEARRAQYQAHCTRHSSAGLFSSLIVCDACGSTFTRKQYTYKNTYVRWVCSKYNRLGKKGCENSLAVDEADLLTNIRECLYSLISGHPQPGGQLMQAYARLSPERDRIWENVEQAILRLQQKKEKYILMFANGVIDLLTLKKEIAAADAMLETLEHRRTALTAFQMRTENLISTKDFLKNLIFQCQWTHADLQALLEKVVVSKTGVVKLYFQ